ncbi:Uma2 family endonuclease [Planktothrix mougeotii]|uniref:Uma2 family endonuclease n=1 Tax=Planktothrix mougeotii LEGE 06226 TaxID=1828728 RepID=A0ABR9UBZ5_9CYAN|nr:Uma2 family endonuclease [Planktothrix mougeotii]MBE9143985.1 Uma2 family endonuclease [Planktothrix mougeotii LEGE 06226]
MPNYTPLKTTILPLENGDRLTRPEFERRYQAMPNHQKAELIEGVVYMASPLRFRSHGEPHAQINTWLGVYYAATPGVLAADNTTVRLDGENEPQPDAILFINPNLGGQCHISEDDYIEGSPELIVEIAASSVAYDLYDKKRAYQRNGVKEYLVWQVYERQICWWKLQEGEYIALETDKNGVIKSQVFPGLWLEMRSLLEGNLAEVLKKLQEGIESLEHQDFIRQLC